MLPDQFPPGSSGNSVTKMYQLSKKNKDTEEYFVGGRSFKGWVLGLSMVGTSISSQFPAEFAPVVEDIANVKLERDYNLDAPQGVAGRNSDNTFIQKMLGWAPALPLEEGMKRTYTWIEQQYADRKAGKRTVS